VHKRKALAAALPARTFSLLLKTNPLQDTIARASLLYFINFTTLPIFLLLATISETASCHDLIARAAALRLQTFTTLPITCLRFAAAEAASAQLRNACDTQARGVRCRAAAQDLLCVEQSSKHTLEQQTHSVCHHTAGANICAIHLTLDASIFDQNLTIACESFAISRHKRTRLENTVPESFGKLVNGVLPGVETLLERRPSRVPPKS